MSTFVKNTHKPSNFDGFKLGSFKTYGKNELLPYSIFEKYGLKVCTELFEPRQNRKPGDQINVTLHMATERQGKMDGARNDLVIPLHQRVQNIFPKLPNADIKVFGYDTSSGVPGQPLNEETLDGSGIGRITNPAKAVKLICETGNAPGVKITGGSCDDVRKRMEVSDVILFLGVESGGNTENGPLHDFSYITLTDRTKYPGDTRDETQRYWVLRTRGVGMYEPAFLEGRARNDAGIGKDNHHGKVGVEWGLWKSPSNWQPELSEDKSDRFQFPAEAYELLLGEVIKEAYEILQSKITELGLVKIFTRLL